MQFIQGKTGRIFVIRLQDDDRLPDVLENFARNQKIESALCFFLGDVKENSRVVVGPKDGNVFPPEPMITLLSGVHEGAGVGTIFVNEEGKPKLHMHAAFGREEETITGCVRSGVDVWLIGEVIVLEITGCAAKRAVDNKTGFELLEVT